MSQVNCGVFPSRAEGWNIPLLELMACGKHVIATDYSAHTEFCNKDNCDLIEINELEPAVDGKWFHGHGQWAKIGQSQVDQLVAYMITFAVSLNRDNDAGIQTSQMFTWDNTSRRIVKCLNC